MKFIKITLLLLLFSIFSTSLYAQINSNRKIVKISKTNQLPKIDGNLLDPTWEKRTILKDFVMRSPNNGENEHPEYPTEVKITYDNNAIYVGAMLYDPNPSEIPLEFSTRDNMGNADYFYITINPNDDGQNSFMFGVEATGNQLDGKISNWGTDFNWSAVWESKTKVVKNGWIVEMKIPYRALRFSNKKEQSWGINIQRGIKKINGTYTWNFIDNNRGAPTQYDGLITGILNIQPPTRLSFYPYASTTITAKKGQKIKFDKSFGMDIKYGLSENFTLDATLIPDFSQAGFDNVQLNLGPFEQYFSEQRQFFTEGTDIFNKGGLFYSRRIGNTPIGRNITLKKDEKIIENPDKNQLLNAFKISGRTENGLGIGFFNAITNKAKAIIKNTKTNKLREVTTQSLTNYNVLVLDKQFNGNSSVSLTNTNVFRGGGFRDANATALSYNIKTKNNKYFIDGVAKMSHINDKENLTGYAFDTRVGKGAGNWQGHLGYWFNNKDFNINDLGFLGSNNQSAVYWNLSYRILKPKGNYNSYSYSTWGSSNFLHHKGIYTGSSIGGNAWFGTRNRFSFGTTFNYNTQRKDYFEAQRNSTAEIFFVREPEISISHWASSDYRKKMAIDYSFFINKSFNIDKLGYGFGLSPRYRFSNKFSLNYRFNYNKTENDRGYVTDYNKSIIFGIRDRDNYTNTLSGKYNFNTKSAISLSFRHNWSKAMYKNFYELNTIGKFDYTTYNQNSNVNFNSWNIDLNYQWQFAPGSQLTVFYRNTIFDVNNMTNINLKGNLINLFNRPMKHVFSLKMVYFIDYNNLKKVFL